MSNFKICIIDVSSIIKEYEQKPNLYEFFKRFPVKDIIDDVLSMPPYVLYSDLCTDQLESRFADVPDLLDFDCATILIESIVADVDNLISRKFKFTNDEVYVLDQWLGRTSIVLKVQ